MRFAANLPSPGMSTRNIFIIDRASVIDSITAQVVAASKAQIVGRRSTLPTSGAKDRSAWWRGRFIQATEARGGGHALSLCRHRQRSIEIAAEPEPARIGLSRQLTRRPDGEVRSLWRP